MGHAAPRSPLTRSPGLELSPSHQVQVHAQMQKKDAGGAKGTESMAWL